MTEFLLQSLDGPAALSTDGLRKTFGNTTALNGLSMTVPTGSVYLLVGPNGAGKTTLLNMMLGQLRPTAGSATVLDRDPRSEGAWVRAATGYVPEGGLPPYPTMRIGELLQHHAGYFGGWDTRYADHLVTKLGVKLDSRLDALSKGEARRAQLVMALAHRPPLLLLDEPTDGLDPVIRDRFFSLLAEHLAEQETTVLVSSHLAYESELFATHLGVIGQGVLSAQLDRLSLDERLRAYTGRTGSGAPLAESLQPNVLQSRDFAGGTEWIAWGEESVVREGLAASGAHVSDARRLTLEEIARVLMSREEVTT